MLEHLVIKAANCDVSCCCHCLDVVSLEITYIKLLSLLQYICALHVQDLHLRAEPDHNLHYQSIYNLLNIKAVVGNKLSEMLDTC
jgi:hypothetical protein